MSTRNLIPIVSYPKSGNTWTRLVMESLWQGAPVAINAMGAAVYGQDRRMLFDALAPVAASELLPHEVAAMLPEVLRHVSREAEGLVFIKSHQMAHGTARTHSGDGLFPPECVRAVLHIVRHPCDVAPSYAHHLGIGIDEAIARMGQSLATIAWTPRRLDLPLGETCGSWSEHTLGWLDTDAYPVLTLRYEDLLADPLGQFARAAAVAGIAASADALAEAVAAARFDRLRMTEAEAGFRERPRSSPGFFRSGTSGGGQRELSPAQRAVLWRDHAPAMRRVEYTDLDD